jgi:DNA polymerase III epsilon subunit-like protein
MTWLALDTETTGLRPDRHVPWEVAAVEPDGTEHIWRWRPSDLEMLYADPDALAIGRFADRAPDCRSHDDVRRAAAEIADLVDGRTIVGSNPAFDVAMLTRFLAGWDHDWTAHYRTIDVPTVAAGWLQGRAAGVRATAPPESVALPWSSHRLSQACGIDPPGDDERHTALGDARWVARWFRQLVTVAPREVVA